MKKRCDFFYLHINGELIRKNSYVVDTIGVKDYFDSPFVVAYWLAESDNDVERIKKEAEELRIKLNLKKGGVN